jgi:hypothetical protein
MQPRSTNATATQLCIGATKSLKFSLSLFDYDGQFVHGLCGMSEYDNCKVSISCLLLPKSVLKCCIIKDGAFGVETAIGYMIGSKFLSMTINDRIIPFLSRYPRVLPTGRAIPDWAYSNVTV